MNTGDVLAMLKQVKYDLSVTQTRVDEALRAVAQFPSESPEELICKTCGVPWRSKFALEEHVYNSHHGPLPAHVIAAEARAEADAPSYSVIAVRRMIENGSVTDRVTLEAEL